MSDDEYSPESGRRADSTNILEYVHDLVERHGYSDGDFNPRAFTWTDQRDLGMVRDNASEFDTPILPGFGELGRARNAHDDCGEKHPFVCDECGDDVKFGRTCGQSVCARCARAWNRDLAIRKAAKVRRVRKEINWNTADREHQKIHHQIISPPLVWFNDLFRAGYTLKEAYDLAKKVVKRILSEQRAQGVVFRHSFRGENDPFEPEEHDDIGEWKKRLYQNRDFYGDVLEELNWNPHFHCIVVSDWMEGGEFTTEIEESTGWVIHRIADRNGISLETDGAMARALTYCVSHSDIDVNPDGNNRSAIWEVGSFEGDPIKSSSRFSATPSDLEWADAKVRDCTKEILGFESATTECGSTIPPVDDPDELARQVIEQLYPDDDRRDDVPTDAVLENVAAGNIGVDVTTSRSGRRSVTVTDAFGDPVGDSGWFGSASDLPKAPNTPSVSAADEPLAAVAELDADVDADDDQEESDDHDECSSGCTCTGTYIPLGEFRDRELLDDLEWCAQAANVDRAREVDREEPDDLERWRSTSPGHSVDVAAG